MTHYTVEHHSGKFFVIIWLILLALLFVSIALGRIHNPYLMNALVFSVAFVKTVMVLRYFMQIRLDPWLIMVIMISATLTLVVLLLGTAPDVTFSATTGMKSL